MTNEEFYDKEIAPKLLKLVAKCKERKMAFLASVEYNPAEHGIGQTIFTPPDAVDQLSATQRLIHWSARAKGNVDALIMACITHGKKHGHNSIYLNQLGAKSEVPYSGAVSCAMTITKK